MAKGEQARMDFGCDDPPLFSGTPVPVEVAGPVCGSPGAKQESFATCRVCMDTGKVQVRRGVVRSCTCSAGQEARQKGVKDDGMWLEVDERGEVVGGTYYFQDWFDGAKRDLPDDVLELLSSVLWFEEG